LPSYYGWEGDAVNERQLTLALSHHVKSVYVLTLVGLKQFFARGRSKLRGSISENMRLLTLPCPYLPFPLDHLTIFFVSHIIALFAAVLKILSIVDSIYVRNSLLAFGFMSMRNLARVTVVKFPAFVGDEFSPIVRNRLGKAVVKRLYATADNLVVMKAGRVYVNSETFLESIVRRGLSIRTPIFVISPGVDKKRIENIKTSFKTFGTSEMRIGFVGSLSWWQGADLLV